MLQEICIRCLKYNDCDDNFFLKEHTDDYFVVCPGSGQLGYTQVCFNHVTMQEYIIYNRQFHEYLLRLHSNLYSDGDFRRALLSYYHVLGQSFEFKINDKKYSQNISNFKDIWLSGKDIINIHIQNKYHLYQIDFNRSNDPAAYALMSGTMLPRDNILLLPGSIFNIRNINNNATNEF